MAERWTGLVVFGLGLIWAMLSLQYSLVRGEYVGSGFLPLVVSIIMSLLGIILIFSKSKYNGNASDWPKGKRLHRLLVTYLSLVTYVFLIGLVGFLISSTLYLIVMIRFWGEYSWRLVLPLAIILASANYILFQVWLNVRMPTGLL